MSLTFVRRASLLVALAAGGACTDRDVTSTDPSNAPGQGARTLEAFVAPADLSAAAWFDTTLVGFAGPAGLSLQVVADTAGFQSRALLRFSIIAGQVFIRDTLRDPREFLNGRLIVQLDSALSSVPSAGIVSLYDVEQAFDARSANWLFAVDTPGNSVPWSVPGSALGTPIASDTFVAGAELDTTIVDADTLVGALVLELGAATDSLLKAWRDTLDPRPGLVLALQASGGDVLLHFGIPTLRFDLVPDVTPDTVIPTTQAPLVRTFIFDPPVPPPGQSLAVAGLPSARSYFELRLEDSVLVDGSLQSLRGSSINRAELILTSRPLPAPHASRLSFLVRTFTFVDDVRVYGPKTPLGGEVPEGRATVVPDSLPDAEPFVVELTSAVQRWASTPVDSTPLPIRFVMIAAPEAVGLGNWTFAGAGQPDAPVLRIVFTPSTAFELP